MPKGNKSGVKQRVIKKSGNDGNKIIKSVCGPPKLIYLSIASSQRITMMDLCGTRKDVTYSAWRANMDIQFVHGIFTCAKYIACNEARKGNASIKQCIRDIGGGACFGKSHVTKALYQAALRYYNNRAGDDFHQLKVLMLASTGKAAYNIRGNTIHSTHAIPACQSLKDCKSLDFSRLNTLRCHLGGVKLICLDEISMPVIDGPIFKDLDNSEHCILAPNLRQKHFKMFELLEIMRQRKSKVFAKILNRLREGNHTNADSVKLKERILDDNNELNLLMDVPHLFIQNEKVNNFNERLYQAPRDVKDFDPQPATDVRLQKRMPYFSDNRSKLRREEDVGPAEIPGDYDANVGLEAQQEVRAAVPGPSDDAKDDDNGDLSNYYSDDELVSDDKLKDQENETYEMLTSMF
ncbi:hypothetical protein AWC38_SpisGene14455 [Stylophora pistillata]|uniref:ATP-dependent DNA helicase n=1 Tax=Stylophora pistillata TaxID=50429 RepID=A0A2B4RXM4_STYPI|nr:hypothetical protein AWC38_SpisGene14455 [Stylophora pistillata]